MITKRLPKLNAANLSALSHLKYDVPAGIAVFLVSIPLSLGIALASGVPLFSGLITGIIGGLVVASLGSSALGVSGAAAGLAVIAYTDIQQLGFNAFLLAVVMAGFIQIGLGLAKAGIIAYYFPSSVTNGMLSGIGLIILLKQIPHALGYDRDYEGDLSFIQADHNSSFSELANMLTFITPGAVLISSISLLILIIGEQPFIKKYRFFQLFQGVLLAIIAGIGTNQLLHTFYPPFALHNEHLVNLPVFLNTSDIIKAFNFADFTQLNNPAIYLTALTLALVASLETLLSIEAIDKLDPYKRVTPTNQELIAQGIGNICSGLLGGLPLTQVIIRSAINIRSGAKTKAASFIHGLLFLSAVLLIPALLNKIPLASLASILMVAGYKLASPSLFINMYRAGINNFIPFCATVLGLIFTDMLTGIIIGFGTALVSILIGNYKSAFYFKETYLNNKTIIKFSDHVSFLNKANILQTLNRLPNGSEVVIDASRAKYIDYDIFEIIQNFEQEAALKKIKLTIENLRGFGVLPPLEYARAQTYHSQQALTPSDVLALLKEGNARFVNNLEANRNFLEQVNDTQQGQFPIAIILSCMDSRTSVELIFDQGLGDVFSTRIAGNIINDDILGSMEYACKIAGSKLIVVLGHSHCGAIKGACAGVELDHLTGLLAKIKPAVDAICTEEAIVINGDNHQLVQKVADRNVQLTVQQIKQQSPLLASLSATGEIAIVGGMYDVETGKVNFFNEPSPEKTSKD
ncbi:MAG: bifunctional SulP family inorganic anion transporter/carbonic anhydrase [Methylococcaceae bacterium]|nr:bifunctional SulP family inorganic anion transporter/carbonic anhydrase [Methylococcaceae bacterium]